MERGGFEPPVPVKVRQFSKLLVSATHPPLQYNLFFQLHVIPEGLEPSTYCLEGSCSIQLSYGTIQLFI